MDAKQKMPKNIRRHGLGYRAVFADSSTDLTGKQAGSRRVYGPTCATMEEAIAWLAARRGTSHTPSRTTFAAVWDDLLARCEHRVRPWTMRHYRNLRLTFSRIIPECSDIALFRSRDVRRYISTRLESGVSMSTIVRHELPTLKRVVRHARKLGVLAPDPFADLDLPRVRAGGFKAFAPNEIADILARIRRDHRPGAHLDADRIEFFVRTGLRRMEFVRLRVADFDLPNRRVHVEGKTGNHYVPIGDALMPVVRRLLERPHKSGRLVASHSTIASAFARWRDRLQEPRLSPHVLRHTFATNCARAGVTPYVLRDLMRHRDLTMTSRYLHASPNHMMAGQDAAGDLLGKGTAPGGAQPQPGEQRPG